MVGGVWYPEIPWISNRQRFYLPKAGCWAPSCLPCLQLLSWSLWTRPCPFLQSRAFSLPVPQQLPLTDIQMPEHEQEFKQWEDQPFFCGTVPSWHCLVKVQNSHHNQSSPKPLAHSSQLLHDLGSSKGTQISKARTLTWRKSHSPGSLDIRGSVHQTYRWAHCALYMNSASLLLDSDVRPGCLPTVWRFPLCSLLASLLSLFPPFFCHISQFSSTWHSLRRVGSPVNIDCCLRTLSVLLQSPDLHYLTNFPISHSSSVLKITFIDVSSAPRETRPIPQVWYCVFNDVQMYWVSPLKCVPNTGTCGGHIQTMAPPDMAFLPNHQGNKETLL